MYFVQFTCKAMFLRRFKRMKMFKELLDINLVEKGGGAHMYAYVWEHKFSLLSTTAYWMFTKLGKNEVIKVLHMLFFFVFFFGQISTGADPGRGKNRS